MQVLSILERKVTKHNTDYPRYGAVPLYAVEIAASGNPDNRYGVYDYDKLTMAYEFKTQYDAMAVAFALNEYGLDSIDDLPDFVRRKTLNLTLLDQWTK